MIKTAFEYHVSTSYDRDNMGGHYLDWKNQPLVFKDYPGLLPVVLPAEVNIPHIELFELLEGKIDKEDKRQSLDLVALSSIFRLSYSLTARTRQGSGDFYFRSAASAGALYPCEIYLVSRYLQGLEDGLYHFAIHRHCLYPLRQGNLTPYLIKSLGMSNRKGPVLTFFLSTIYYRSAWKYRERSYRYHLLDTGHLLENLALALKSLGLTPEISFDFDDDEVNYLLGLDDQKEVVQTVVSIFNQEPSGDEDLNTPEKLPLAFSQASRVASKEVDYAPVREIHQAGKVIRKSPEPRPVIHEHLGLDTKEWLQNPGNQARPMVMNYAEAIYQRRSRRNFIKEPLDKEQWVSIFDALNHTIVDSDFEEDCLSSLAIGLLINHVQDISPGFYLLDRQNHSTGLVNLGSYGSRMAPICLDQAWLSNAAIHVLFLTNLKLLDETRGPRGYRYAMMAAGCLGQRIYLLATAMGLGCCGIGAFYDQEASDLLGLNRDSRLLYLAALGPVKSQA